MIYTSPQPSVPIQSRSIFTHLFHSDPSTPDLVGGFPASSPAFIDADTGTTLSRGQLKHLSLSLAHGLRTHPFLPAPHQTLKRGDTILIYSPNTLLYPVLLHAATAAGLRATLANTAYTARELHHQWTDSRARVICVHPANLGVVREMFKDEGLAGWESRVVVLDNKWLTGVEDAPHDRSSAMVGVESLTQIGKMKAEERFDGEDANETVYLCYSSGTTGKPKGVETTHRNMTAVIDIIRPCFPLAHNSDVMLGILPFYHIYGAVKLLHFPLSTGIPTIITPRFDPVTFCAHIARYKCTVSLVVPPVLVVLVRHPAIEQHDLRSLRVLISGAAPLGASLVEAFTTRLHTVGANVVVAQGYGLTETSPTTHLVPLTQTVSKVGTIGTLLPNLEARLVDGDDDRDVPEGARGELWIRGPTIMKGYLNNTEATRNAITPDGWFRTGDIAIRDKDGFYSIVDRKKELIKYKGFQVPPAELESVLLEHPDIADAAVIGVESIKQATELPRAYVVHARPASVGSASAKAEFGRAVQTWIASRVARHKHLRGGVVVLDAVPKSAAGKILRRELRERAKGELLAEEGVVEVAVKAKL